MVREKAGGKRVRKVTDNFELKPSSYQPTKKELEADLSLPASFDEVMDALFERDKGLKQEC